MVQQSNKGRDFYAILGVSRDVDDAALKKAYKKLALRWHPDKQKKAADRPAAEKKFKDVAEAFAVLSDPEKRKVYDRFGEEGLQAGISGDQADSYGAGSRGHGMGGSHGFEMPPEFAENLFAQFFGGGGGGGGFASSGRRGGAPGFMFQQQGGGGMHGFDAFSENPQQAHRQPLKKRPAIARELEVSLEDLCQSVTKKLKLTRKLYDEPSGRYTDVVKVVELPLKPQMKAGTKFTFKGLGNEEPNYEAADMVFTLKEKPHAQFSRNGDDLTATVSISLKDALLGGHTVVRCLDGSHVRVPYSPLSSTVAAEAVIRERGMPNTKTGKRGDLHVRFNVEMPGSADKRRELAGLL